ncbi:CdaR family protein [Carnobacterium alterfunditum]|uniref:CdaR family protein n=1 Tax=Carnobacterium alterfunditum TaxID=28230 RepID=UPI0035934491
MEKIYNNPWFIKIVALAFAILLFTYVNSSNNRGQTTSNVDGLSATTTDTILEVPIVVEIDQDNYYVTGFPETVSVDISGPSSIVLNTKTTKNFDIVAADLDSLGVGTHTIELVAEGLSPQLDYKVSPEEVTITIEEKKVETFSVEVEFDDSLIEEDFEAGTPTIDYETIELTGTASTIDQVEEVKVVVNGEEGITEDIVQTLPIVVSDADGEKLDVELNPSEVTVSIPVDPIKKEVPIVLNQMGTADADLSYELGISNQSATTVAVQADNEILSSLSSYPIDINVTDITETTTQTIELPLLDGVTIIDPEKIDVTITVTKKNSQENEQNTTEINDESSSSNNSSSSSESTQIESEESESEPASDSASDSSSEKSDESSSESSQEVSE